MGKLRDVFAKWLAAAPATNHTERLDWQELVWPIVQQTLHKAGDVDGVILATTKGDIAKQVAWMRALDAGHAQPSEPPTLGATLAELMNASGLTRKPGWIVSTACSSGLVALIDAAIAVQQGEMQRVLVVAADVSDSFMEQGFAALKALSATGVCRPFDRHRDGLMLGAAAAACIVSPLTDRSICELRSFGISNDATHMTAPDREARGLIRAIQQTLARASLTPNDIDALFLHGTGTRYNDAMEATALRQVFSPAGHTPAVTAVKGLIGHTLGTSGLVEALLAAQMIAEQTIPGIIGLEDPEYPDIAPVRPHESPPAPPPRRPIRHLLNTASGFGGMNAAVLLSKVTE